VKRALILTHSDASTDSRILKTHEAAKASQMKTMSLGVRESQRQATQIKDTEVVLLNNLVRAFRDHFRIGVRPGSTVTKTFLAGIYFELAIKMIIRGLIFRPHLIHCNDWFVLPIAVVLKTLSRAKLIYDAHELESRTPANPSVPGRLVERIERALWPRIDFFTTVSPSIENWYTQNFGPKASSVILNSPKIQGLLDPALPRSDYLRKRYNLPPGTKIYLYIGMLGLGRGIDITLDAFCQTSTDSAVVFLGYGEYRDRIKQLEKTTRNIYFHERVDHQLVVEIARSADYGLCLIENASLSDYFCIPNKLLEYAFAGLPVVASKLPEIQRIVEEYKLGECFENTTETLLAVLDANAQTGSTSKLQSRNLRDLSWEAQASKLGEIFEGVLANNERTK